MKDIPKILASYIIFKDVDGKIKAANGATGVVDYSGTDATVVIQNVINVMSDGQTLFIKYGIYDLTTAAINVTKAINIIGEGVGTTGISSNGMMYGCVLQRAGTVLNVSLTNNKFNIFIKNIGLDGIDQSNSVLILRKFHGTVSNVIIKNGNIGLDAQDAWTSDYYSIKAYGNNIGGQIATSAVSQSNFYACAFNFNDDTGFVKSLGSSVNFMGCNFEANGQFGIRIESGFLNLDGCYFETNPNYRLDNQTTGAHIKIGTDTIYPNTIRISNCYLGGQDTNINIIQADRIWVRHGYNILIENCLFYQSSGQTVRTDINNDQGSDVQILLVNCFEFHDGIWTIDGTTGITSINTKGWITKNNVISGTFAVDSIGIKIVTIPHGLNIVPNVQDCCLTVIQNTAVDDWAYNMIKVVLTDATNVTVKINISTASKTVGATAKLALRVGNP